MRLPTSLMQTSERVLGGLAWAAALIISKGKVTDVANMRGWANAKRVMALLVVILDRGHIGVTALLTMVFISLIYDLMNQFASLITPKMTAQFIVRWGD